MDIAAAFNYIMEDEDWVKKLAIGGGLIFIAYITSFFIFGLVLFIPVVGYFIQTIKNVMEGKQRPLPEWNFGEMFSSGGTVFAIGIIYQIPMFLLFCCMTAIYIPMMISPESANDFAGPILIAFVCLACLMTIVSLITGIMLPAAIIRYAQRGTLGSAFEFGAIFSFISSNIGNYVILILLSWAANFVASFGAIACFVGVFFTTFWAMLFIAHLMGQLARGGNAEMQPQY